MHTRMLALVTAALLVLASSAPAAILRVWSPQYPTIQSAIDAAKNGDTVLVGKGTFWESIDFKGKAITVKSEFGPEITNIRGTVHFRNGEGRTSVLQGFSVFPATRRADNIGLRIVNASPTIRGNHIGREREHKHEVGIHCTGGQPLVEGNIVAYGYDFITTNNATVYASGIRLFNSNAEILYNRIEHNDAPGTSSTKVKDVGNGGGMYVTGGAPRIEGNLIRNNTCRGHWAYGGGIHLSMSRALVARNAILDNTVGANNSAGNVDGGGIFARGGQVEIRGNVIARNGTPYCVAPHGAGVWADQGRIIHNTIFGNKLWGFLPATGAGIFGSSAVEVRNNIVWKNTGSFNNTDALGGALSTLKVHTNLLDDGPWKGVNGNITGDPLFVNATGGDFHLQPGSPCIDAGSAVAAPTPALDFDFEPRVIDGRGDTHATVDMGADEFATLRKPAIFVRPGTKVPLALKVPAAAGRGFVLACAFGYSTGIPMPPPDPRRIPLDSDALFAVSVAQNNAIFGGFLGALDTKGKAAAAVTVPALPALAGLTFHAGGIAIRPDGKIVILNRLDIDVLP